MALPVIIIESDSEAEARDSREKRSEQRELDDLAAQQGMQDATVEMAKYALLQTILVFVGTVALVATLVLTRKQANAAVNANELIRSTSERQLRPYLVFVEGTVTFAPSENGWSHDVSVKFRNTGATPAIISIESVHTFAKFKGKIAGGGGTTSSTRQIVGQQADYFIERKSGVGNTALLERNPIQGGFVIAIFFRYSGSGGESWDEETWLGATAALHKDEIKCQLKQQQKPKEEGAMNDELLPPEVKPGPQ